MEKFEHSPERIAPPQLNALDILPESKQFGTGKSAEGTNLPQLALTDNQNSYANDHKSMSNAMLDNVAKPPEQASVFANSNDLKHDAARYASVPEGKASQPPGQFEGVPPNAVGRGSADCELTSFKVWQKDKDIQIETATKNIESIKLSAAPPAAEANPPAPNKVPIESCSISQNGNEIASIKNENGKLKYEYTDLAKNHQSIELRSAEYDSNHNMILKTTNDHRIELRADGSQVTYDDKSGHPIKTIDYNGNEFNYHWGDKGSLDSLTIQGPMTSKQLLEFDKAGVVDQVMDNIPQIVGSSLVTGLLCNSFPIGGPAVAEYVGAKLLTPAGKYKVFVEGREQAATLSLGAGAGVGMNGMGVSASMGMPVQRTVNLGVLDNGGLLIDQPSETWNGMIKKYHSTIALIPDGTSTLIKSDTKTPIRRANNGMAI